MADQNIRFRFGGNAEDLEKMFSRAEQGFDHLEGLAKTLEGAFAFEKIREGFMGMVEESDKAELSQRKLALAFQGTGQAGDPAAISELASRLEELTEFEDDCTVEAAAMMARFKLSGEQIEKLLPATQDLAAALGTDLVGSADAVGKAVEIGSAGLRSLNLGFTQSERAAFDLANANQRVEMITGRIEQRMGGFATMVGGTATGAAKQFANAMGNAGEAMGGVINKPVAAVLQSLTNTVREATHAFENLSPTARGAIAAVATGVGGIAAVTAGGSALLSVLGRFAPVVGPLVTNFASMMNAQLNVASATGSLSSAFTAFRATAMAAWGGVILPILAVAGAVVGVIGIVGAASDLWKANIGGVQEKWAGLMAYMPDSMKMVFDWMRDALGGFVNGAIEKFTLLKAMVTGLSPEEAGSAVREALASASTIGDDISAGLETGMEMLKDGAKLAGDAFSQSMSSGIKTLGLDKMLSALAAAGAKAMGPGAVAAGKGGGGDHEAMTLKTAFAGMTDKAIKLADQAMAQSLLSAIGGGSLKKTAAFLDHLETVTGLSEQTLTTILTKTKVGAAGLESAAMALRDVSDATANALLKAGAYNMKVVGDVAQQLKGVSDGAITAVLKTGASLADLARVAPTLKVLSDDLVSSLTKAGASAQAIANIAPKIRNLSDDAVKSFLTAGGSLQGLAQFGSQFDQINGVMATSTAQATAYWQSFNGQMALLKGRAEEAGLGIASSMGAAGGAFTNAMGALEHGDVMGAVIGGMASVVTQSKSFQEISKIINDMFSNFAQALNPLFDGLSPILLLVGSLMSAIGGAIRAIMVGIQPIFAIIGAVLGPIFTIVNGVFGSLKTTFQQLFSPIMPIVKSLMPIFKVIGDLFSTLVPIIMKVAVATSPLNIVFGIVGALFKALEPVFKIVSTAIGAFINLVLGVFKGLASGYNAVVRFIADTVQKLISIIPGMGDAAKDFANKIRGACISIQDLDAGMKAVTVDATTQTDVTFPALENAVDSVGSASNSASQEIGNAPQGFKVALAEFQAATALSAQAMQQYLALTNGTLGTPTGASTVPQVVAGSLPSVSPSQSGTAAAPTGGSTVNMYVTAADPTALAGAVESQLTKNNLQATGNPQTTTRQYTLPSTASSFK